MFKFKFKTLSDLFSALILSFNGEKVELEIPENLIFIKENIILSRFISENVFQKNNKKLFFDFSSLEKTAKLIHKISPNTFYYEKICCAIRKNHLRDFFNHFKTKSYREISSFREEIFSSENFSLNPDFTLKTAPAYRCNYSRLIVSTIKTLKDLGAKCTFIKENDEENKETVLNYTLKKFDGKYSPLKNKTLYIPQGCYLFSRCNDFYIANYEDKTLETPLTEIIQGFRLEEISQTQTVKCSFVYEDFPLEAYLIAEQNVKKLLLNKNLKDLSTLRLNGSDFEFSPSATDVMGYSDLQFDLIKRLGVNVNDFKNAVFDFGTHIEEIINTAYDLFPQFHNGQKAFEKAIEEFVKNEKIRL